jgi:redox-sensitive bicupin YhaK (pirin superfamily)
MKKIFHAADSRGKADHGWLKANHSFSFANYFNPERIQFGALRVLNDDIIAPGMGFGTHPHNNMEIITIPLEGALEHKDSMDNSGVITSNEIQVMSAGTGIYHSEFNHHKNEKTNILQLWVFPNKQDVTPRYDQMSIESLKKPNQLYQVVSPHPEETGMWIHQDAWFHLGEFDQDTIFQYEMHKPNNGVYAFAIEGQFTIAEQVLEKRDALGISEINTFEVRASKNSKILTVEVPME